MESSYLLKLSEVLIIEKLKRQVFRLKTGDDITLVYLLSNIKGENFVKKSFYFTLFLSNSKSTIVDNSDSGRLVIELNIVGLLCSSNLKAPLKSLPTGKNR